MVVGCAVAIAVLINLPTLGFEFIHWDDLTFIVYNPVINPAGEGLINQQPHNATFVRRYLLTWELGYPIPVTQAVWFGWSRTLGFNSAAFHALCILLHAINVALLMYLGRLLGVRSRFAMATGALLVVVHPMMAESLGSVTVSKDLLAILFFQFGLVALISPRQKPPSRPARTWLIVTGCFLLSVLCKPMVVAAWVLYFYLPNEPATDSRWPRRLAALFMVAVSGAIAALTTAAQRDWGALRTQDWSSLGPALQDWLAYWTGQALLTVQLILGLREQTVYYAYEPATGWALALQTAAVVALVSLLLVVAWRGRRKPIIGFAALWIVLFYAPSSGLFGQIHRFVANSYAYAPLFGLALVAMTYTERLQTRLSAYARKLKVRPALAGALLLVGILSTVYGLAYGPALMRWQSTESLFTPVNQADPGDPRAALALAKAALLRTDGTFEDDARGEARLLLVEPDYQRAHDLLLPALNERSYGAVTWYLFAIYERLGYVHEAECMHAFYESLGPDVRQVDARPARNCLVTPN